MAVTAASPGDQITASLWNQLAGLVNGTSNFGNPVILNQLSSDSFWAITARNQGSLGQALRVQNAAGSANLLTVADAGVVVGNTPLKALSYNSSSTYGVQIQNVATSQTKILNVLNAEGDQSLFNIQRSAGGNDCVSINTLNGIVPESNQVVIGWGGSADYQMVEMAITCTDTTGGQDAGAMRAVAYQNISGGNSLMRAGEFRAYRYAPAITAGTWGIEVGLSTDVTGAGVTSNVGIYCANGAGAPGEVRADTAFLSLGTVGWKQPFLALDTDNTTQLFKVDQTGRVYTVAGTAALPAFTFIDDPDTGIYSNGANNLAFSTAGAFRAIFDQLGNFVVGSAVATNATNGFLYIPTCAGTPTGVPTTYTGRVALICDTTNHVVYFYDGSWRALN